LFRCCFFFKHVFFFSSRRRHTRFSRDWSSDVCSSDLIAASGMADYVSPDRATAFTGHLETATGAESVRDQTAAAPLASGDYQLDGTGVGVAILDSGLDAGHAAFRKNGTSRIVAAIDFTNSGSNDPNGHGSHVAGLAVGSSTINGGAYR